MADFFTGFPAAVRFLTVLPVPGWRREDDENPRSAAAWFPVVGLLVGGVVAASLLLPLSPAPRGALALALWVGMTGGLHEDGWADCMDAAFAPTGGGRLRRLEILKDPRVGAHGLTGTVLLLLLRFGALTVVAPAAVILAAIVGRWAMSLTLAWIPSPVSRGLGHRYGRGVGAWASSVLATMCIGGLAWVWSGTSVLSAVLLSAVVGSLWAGFLARRFGGLTGDGHGAVGLAVETVALYGTLLSPALPW